EPALAAQGVKTLVFVADGELRTVPMAALYDGERFLIEKYAIAVAPGLKLTDVRPLARARQLDVLAAGISDKVQGFNELPGVRSEVDQIFGIYGGRRLLNAQFKTEPFEGELRRVPYSVVHIASHGQFDRSADPEKTFVLTYNGKLNLNELERLIQPSQFRGQPVELLALSACETASGPD